MGTAMTMRQDWTNGNDPFGWLEELQEALEAASLEEFETREPKAVSEEAKRAAYQLAVALGRCRAFGVLVPVDIDGTLHPQVAIAAAEIGETFLRQWIEHAEQLGVRWDQAEPELAETMCAELLEARMEALFVLEALSEAQDASWNEPASIELWDAVNRYVDALAVFDEALQTPENLALLSTLVNLPLLENWRQSLAGDYKEVLPWWLDGTLEKVDQQITEYCRRTLPAGEVWRRMMERRQPSTPSPVEAPQPEVLVAAALAIRMRRRWHEMIKRLPAAMAMAAQPAVESPEVAVAHWRSPEGKYIADMPVPLRPVVGQPVYLKVFRTEDAAKATELAGQPVVLAGLQAVLDEQGRAAFSLEELQRAIQAGADPTLKIGPDLTPWEELPLEGFPEQDSSPPNG
jgi:hypothetical protein